MRPVTDGVIVNAVAGMVMPSWSKVASMPVSTGTWVAPSSGSVPTTRGAWSTWYAHEAASAPCVSESRIRTTAPAGGAVDGRTVTWAASAPASTTNGDAGSITRRAASAAAGSPERLARAKAVVGAMYGPAEVIGTSVAVGEAPATSPMGCQAASDGTSELRGPSDATGVGAAAPIDGPGVGEAEARAGVGAGLAHAASSAIATRSDAAARPVRHAAARPDPAHAPIRPPLPAARRPRGPAVCGSPAHRTTAAPGCDGSGVLTSGRPGAWAIDAARRGCVARVRLDGAARRCPATPAARSATIRAGCHVGQPGTLPP